MNQYYVPESQIPARFQREMTRHPVKPFPRVPVEREYRFDGQGGYAPHSGRIPWDGWLGGALFIIGFTVMCWIGYWAAF